MKFPPGFVWGAATSSYQIEGAAWRDGGGYSVWDMFARHDGKIVAGDTGEVACDHFNRYAEDVALMADLGLQAYRFSVSWPRILPAGVGSTNQRGLDFYDRLVDALLANDIEPWLTLFHWDFPYELYCRGGWLNRASADWFADYTQIMVAHLSEPQVYIGLGHHQGSHAPGLSMAFGEALRAAHHTLLAHGKAVQVIRANARKEPVISAAHAGNYFMPLGDNPVDIEAARARNFAIVEKDFFNNSWFSDPMLLGNYPEDGLELFAADMPEIRAGDMATICQPLDYFGANIYWGHYGRATQDQDFELVAAERFARTDLDWPVTPEVLYWAPKFYHQRYGLPLVVTENGMANADVGTDVMIDDEARIEFINRYLYEYARAIADGVPCLGYITWSLLDNFEWAEGYAKRFGMIHVDYQTQQRTPKQSAYWYRDVIAANAVSPYLPAEQRRASA
jgi:beta-glucosidase